MPPKVANQSRYTSAVSNNAALAGTLGRSPKNWPEPSIIAKVVAPATTRWEVPKPGVLGFGVIIQATLYDQWTPTTAGQTPSQKVLESKSVAAFRWNEYAIQKSRYCVVIHVYSDSYVACPIYTHEGKGISEIWPEHRGNFLRMYDPRAWLYAKPENTNDRDLHVDMLKSPSGHNRLDQCSHLRATYFTSLPRRYKKVNIVGYLTPASAQKLRVYYERRPWDRQVSNNPLIPAAFPSLATNGNVSTTQKRSASQAGMAVELAAALAGAKQRQTRSSGSAESVEIDVWDRPRFIPQSAPVTSPTSSQGRAGRRSMRFDSSDDVGSGECRPSIRGA